MGIAIEYGIGQNQSCNTKCILLCLLFAFAKHTTVAKFQIYLLFSIHFNITQNDVNIVDEGKNYKKVTQRHTKKKNHVKLNS